MDAPGIPRETRLGRRVEEDLGCDTVRGFLGLKLDPKQRYTVRCEETCFITDHTVAQVQFALCLSPVNIW